MNLKYKNQKLLSEPLRMLELAVWVVNINLGKCFLFIEITVFFVTGDRRGHEHSGEEVYSNSVRVFDTGVLGLLGSMLLASSWYKLSNLGNCRKI